MYAIRSYYEALAAEQARAVARHLGAVRPARERDHGRLDQRAEQARRHDPQVVLV